LGRRAAEETLPEALAAWDFDGQVLGASRHGTGHINDTFCVETRDAGGRCVRFILQRINTEVFHDPAGLMENICGVTRYLRGQIIAQGGDPGRETLHVVPPKHGGSFYTDSAGGAWRVFTFVEGAVCLEQVEQPADFYESACMFGTFQRLLDGYPAHTLHETIPRFHDTVDRYRNFEKALAADPCGRARGLLPEIDFVKAHEKDCHTLLDLQAQGKLPLRVTHNDTKLTNILMDASTRKGLCVIDLDTVMPGLAANDFGDAVRFGANDCAEDEPDLAKVHFSLPLFEEFTRGFLAACGGALTPLEKETLPWGAKLMTLECGIRFLTDYLEGDRYFKIHREGQNLDRCRTQFKLTGDMERHWEEMARIVKKYS